MTVKINSINLNKKRKIDTSRFARVAEKVLKELGRDGVELNLVFVSNQKIRAMNRKWFERDNSTDVIAWPAAAFDSRLGDYGSLRFIGDVAVSSDKAAGNAVEYGNTFKDELALYVIHGILHLLGYRDTDAGQRAKMKRKENELSEKVRKFI